MQECLRECPERMFITESEEDNLKRQKIKYSYHNGMLWILILLLCISCNTWVRAPIIYFLSWMVLSSSFLRSPSISHLQLKFRRTAAAGIQTGPKSRMTYKQAFLLNTYCWFRDMKRIVLCSVRRTQPKDGLKKKPYGVKTVEDLLSTCLTTLTPESLQQRLRA